MLIACSSGILSVVPTKLLKLDSTVTSSKKVRIVKSSDKVEMDRRTSPKSISWWATYEAKALALIGTKNGLVIAIDLVDGKEVLKNYLNKTENPSSPYPRALY
jgi:hypothetical protein